MNNKKNDSKRWIAVGVSLALLIISSLSSSISNMTNISKETSEKGFSSTLSELLDPETHRENIISGSNPSERILVLNVNGLISDSGASPYSSGSSYNHQDILKQLDNISKDSTIKGIILRVDSPGGTTFASAQLRDKIVEVKEATKIPIYTSMGSLAASGGYYISAPTDKIYASEETMTGSIGVIMNSVNITGLYEKLGIKDNTIKSGAHKDMLSPSKPVNEEDNAIVQNLITGSYNRFVKVVSEGRKMPEDRVRQLADGRIYDGAQALEVQLVDKIGYFQDVVKDMANDLNLSDPQVFDRSYTRIPNIFNMFGFKSKKNNSLDDLTRVLEAYQYPSSPTLMYLYGGE